MSWLFSRVLVEEYLGASCSDGVPSAPLSVMPSPQPFWHNAKTMEPSDLSRFGPTCAPLTAGHGEAVLTSFLEAFPARTSPPLEKALDSTVSAAASGAKWHASFAKFDPAMSSWKTPQCSLLGDLELFSATWPRWGLMRGGECWELAPLVPPTSVSASGSLPTLTLVSCEHPGRIKVKPNQQTCISAVLAKRDGWKAGGQYSPSHAAWLMGWPDSWTSLGPSATVKFQQWLHAHGACLPEPSHKSTGFHTTIRG